MHQRARDGIDDIKPGIYGENQPTSKQAKRQMYFSIKQARVISIDRARQDAYMAREAAIAGSVPPSGVSPLRHTGKRPATEFSSELGPPNPSVGGGIRKFSGPPEPPLLMNTSPLRAKVGAPMQ